MNASPNDGMSGDVRNVLGCARWLGTGERLGRIAILVLVAACWGGVVPGYADEWVGTIAAGPAARSDACAIWDPVGNSVIVFGGTDEAGALLNDTWRFSLSTETWSEISVSGPSPAPRAGQVGILDPVRHRVVVQGGWTGEWSDQGGEVWALSLDGTPTWSQLWQGGDFPVERFDHLGVYDADRDRLIVFGGEKTDTIRLALRDTWAFSFAGNTWSMLDSEASGPTIGCAGVYDPDRQSVVRFGGREYVTGACADRVTMTGGGAYVLPLDPEGVWSQLACTGVAPVRSEFGAVLDHIGKRVLTFGGVSRNDCAGMCNEPTETAFGTTFYLSLTGVPQWSSPSVLPEPAARGHYSIAYDPAGHRLFVFGGGVRSRVVGGNCNQVTRDCTYYGDLFWLRIAPDSVENLFIDMASESEAWPGWTAPGEGVASGEEYDLRYSTAPITEANFASATQVVGEPTPGLPGSYESMGVFGLQSDTDYWFALRTKGACGNWSRLSNVAYVRTISGGGWCCAAGESPKSEQREKLDRGFAETGRAASADVEPGGAVRTTAIAAEIESKAGSFVVRAYELGGDAVADIAGVDGGDFLVQTLGRDMRWTTERQLRTSGTSRLFGLRGLLPGTRVVFLGPYGLGLAPQSARFGRNDGRVAASVQSAYHSRLGDVTGAISANGGFDAGLSPGDSLTIVYAQPGSSAGARDWFLLVRRSSEEQEGTGYGAKGVPPSAEIPAQFALAQNRPNPFSQWTTIRFALPITTEVRLEILDLAGRRVKVVADGQYPAGYHSVEWDKTNASGASVAPGVYVYRLTAGTFRAQKKMTLLP